MKKCKTKAIQADLSIFTHVLTYSGIFRHIQDISRHNQIYSGLFWSYSGILSALFGPDIF